MKVNVNDFLAGGFPVGQEEVHPFTLQLRSSKGASKPLRDFEHASARRRREVAEVNGVFVRNDKQVARIDRLDDVHEGRDQRIAINHAGRRSAGNDVAEDAGGRGDPNELAVNGSLAAEKDDRYRASRLPEASGRK